MKEGEEDNDGIMAIDVLMGGEESHIILYPVDPHHQEKEESPSSSTHSSSSSDNKFIILDILVSIILFLVQQVAAYICGDRYGPLREGYAHYDPRE